MQNSIFTNRRMFAGIIAAMMLFTVLFSYFYIASEVNHDCIGENCPICESIQICENTVKKIGSGLITIAVLLFSFVHVYFPKFIYNSDISFDTPISLKIRMNN